MTWVWAHSPYSGERLLLHLALADFANDEGICFPSHATLARKARCSTGWVSQTIKQMIADDLLEVVERAGNGRGKVGRYRLLKGPTECDLSPPLGLTPTPDRSHLGTSDAYLLNRQEPLETGEQFETLWKAYPRKTAKGAARRSFDRIMRRKEPPTVAELVSAVERYSQQFSSGAVSLNYCAHLATWLNGERWLDEQPKAETVGKIETNGEHRAAESMAAAFVHTNRTEADLVDSLAPYSPAAQTAALALFRAMKAGSR